MISYNYKYPFRLKNEEAMSSWIRQAIGLEHHELGELIYTFMNDDELLELNKEFLGHDTFTDIISFDYTVGKIIQGEVFISVERVKDNAQKYSVDFETELSRVMIHGVLHYCGYKDGSAKEKQLMRSKEDYYLSLLR
jgi:probable rRNA maturation factor